jgi:Do/DeqQ family serine protease
MLKALIKNPAVLACALTAAWQAALFASPDGTEMSGLDLARKINQAFIQVADEVSPSVVVITVTQKPGASSRSPDSYDDESDPWEEFRRFLQQHNQDQQSGPAEKPVAQGSGIIIRRNGFILTNRHVIEDAESIEVRLKDGRTFKGEVKGFDIPADVAVVKIEAEDLPVASLADSDKTRVGEFAIAIGAPFSLDYSVTYGHVSAKDRTNIIAEDDPNSNGMVDQSFIQTDANINPGNSGGPLVNIDGKVIGINTLIRGLHTGIGFAIPINLAREISDQIISQGKFARCWLGINIRSLREYPEFRDFVSNLQDGVVVDQIQHDGPAAKSSLKPEDVITAVDGTPVVTSQQLKDEIRRKKAGQEVILDVFRTGDHGGKMIKVSVHPQEYVDKSELASGDSTQPADHTDASNPLGLTVRPITSDLAHKYHLESPDGLVVTLVDKEGLAYQGGIQEGDVVTTVDGHSVSNLKQFRESMKNADTHKGVRLHLIADGDAQFKVLRDETP